MAEISGEKVVAHNKFGLEIDGQDIYVLTISGFGGTIKNHLLRANDKAGKSADVHFVANSNVDLQPISATRPIDGDPTWSDWFDTAAGGDTESVKKNGSVHFYSAKGDSAELSFAFTDAIPTSYTIAASDSNSDSVSTEQITFSVASLKKA